MAHRGVCVFSPQISFVPLVPSPTATTLSTVLARPRPGRWLPQSKYRPGPQFLPQPRCTGLRHSSPCGMCKSHLPPALFSLDCSGELSRRLDGDEARSLRLREKMRLGCRPPGWRICLLGRAGGISRSPKGFSAASKNTSLKPSDQS